MLVIQTIQTLIELCFLRKSPRDLPYSPLLFILLGGICVGLDIWFFNQGQIFPGKKISVFATILSAIAGFILLVSILYYVLKKRGLTERLYKVLSAWFGTTLILGLLGLIMPPLAGTHLLFLIWEIFVKANILKLSLGITTGYSLILTIGISFCIGLVHILLLLSGAS